MKQYQLSDGRMLSAGQAFDCNEVRYPANWLELATPQDLIDHGIVEVDVPDAEPSLSDLRADYLRRVEDDAEQIRLKFITPGDGMQMTYREKFEQAHAVHNLGETAANALTETERRASYPTLAASVGVEAPTLFACAELVLARYTIFAQASYAIERARLSGKKAISEASDAAGIRAAYGAIQWPT